MKFLQEVGRPLPVDSNGRVRMPANKRAEILAEFAASGMTGIAFARHIGVKYPTFASWLRLARLGNRSLPSRGHLSIPRTPDAKGIRFLEATPVPASSPAALEIVFPGGACLRITAASQLPLTAELLRRLAAC